MLLFAVWISSNIFHDQSPTAQSLAALIHLRLALDSCESQLQISSKCPSSISIRKKSTAVDIRPRAFFFLIEA